MNSARISLLTVVLLLLFSVVLRANPFTSEPAARDGHGGLPEPAAVRTARPDESLIQRQMALRNRIAEMFVQWKDGSNPSALRILLVLSFLYGYFMRWVRVTVRRSFFRYTLPDKRRSWNRA